MIYMDYLPVLHNNNNNKWTAEKKYIDTFELMRFVLGYNGEFVNCKQDIQSVLHIVRSSH